MRAFQVVESNLREAMCFFGHATGTGEVRDLDGLRVIYCGLDYGVFNIGMFSRAPERGALEARLEACACYFEQRQAHWSFWLCEDWVSAPRRGHARAALSALGLRQISTAPGMVAEEGLAPARRPLPPLECVPVAELTARQAFGAITATCFDIPMPMIREVYERERAWCGVHRGYLGLARGAPVSIVAVAPAAGSLGIYSLATLPEARRQGYAEALLRAAVARESARTGIQRLVLQSTEAGHSLYRRLGFREVTRFSVHLMR